MARPLCITADPHLLDDVLALAAEAGLEIDVSDDPTAVQQAYVEAPLVVIGDRSAGACADARLPRRPDVFVVTREASAKDWLRPLARLLGAERIVPLPHGTQMLLGRFSAAAGLAVTASRAGLRTRLVDADPLGGGVDLAVGWDTQRPDLTVLSCARAGL